MKRVYQVDVELGWRIHAYSYNVIAASAGEAIKKALRDARKQSERKSGWRVTSLTEKAGQVIA